VTAPFFARAASSSGRALQRLSRPAGVLCALAWAGGIWILSSSSGPGVALGSGDAGSVISNLAHAPEFGILTLLVCLVLPRSADWVRTDTAVLRAAWLVVLAYAIVDELHQSKIPMRNASVLDVLTDATAALLVLLAVRFSGGERADERALGRVLAYGLLACLACALCATFVPRLAPDWSWL
jgi:hypothetical protein